MIALARFIHRNLEGRRGLVLLALTFTLAQVAADLAIAYPLKFILDKAYQRPARDPSFPFAHALISPFNGLGTPAGPHEQYTVTGVIVFSTILLVIIGAATAVLSYAQLFIASAIGQTLAIRIRVHLFDHLQRLSMDWHGRQRTGDLVQRLTSNVQDIEKLVTDGLVDLLAGVLTLIGALMIMLYYSWQFTLITMVVVPGLFAVVLGYTKSIKSATKRAAKATAQVADVATEDLGAIAEIKAFTLEHREARNFRRFAEQVFEAKFCAGTLQAEFTPLVLLLVTASTAAIIGIGSDVASGNTFSIGPLSIAAGSITFGTLTVYLTYLKQLYQPMRDLSKLANLASSASSGADRIQAALDEPPEATGSPKPYHGPARVRGQLRYSGVAFGYLEGTPVLHRVDLDIPAGRKFALVGLSGSGKTTMVKLIPRFYDAWDGSVEIDGVDVRDYPLSILRSNISLVLQDSVLFEGVVRDNLAIGRPDATDAEIVEAATHAHIHDQIMALPGGYGAPVREAGKNFSGGQRQRIAIARAMLRAAPILILDEPTANLDVEAEAEVMHAIDKLIHGRTVVMISHRLSTLGHADEIVVLADGRIAEQGSYHELKRLGGVFAGLLEEQNRYSAERVDAEPARRGRIRHFPAPAASASMDASKSMSRWVDLSELGEGREADGGTVADLRRLRRAARQESR